jgi:hypothetical protein
MVLNGVYKCVDRDVISTYRRARLQDLLPVTMSLNASTRGLLTL